MKEMRCDHKLHGVLIESGIVEFKCNSAFCGAEPGVVVLHRFSAETGNLIETKKYKDPTVRRSTRGRGTSVRTA